MKTNRFNTIDTKTTGMNKINIIKLTPRMVCECYGPSCSYYKQNTLQPSPINSDQSSEGWDGNKAKAKEENKSLIDFEASNQKTDTEKFTDIDEVPLVSYKLDRTVTRKNCWR